MATLNQLYARTQWNGDCLEWTGPKNPKGYGQVAHQGVTQPAHRVMWELEFGEIVPYDIYVCHTCDNPCCVNTDHLFLGTPGDNVRDMVAKGRNVAHREDPEEALYHIMKTCLQEMAHNGRD